MVLKEQNILFFARTMNLGGTENVILQLCEIFKPLVHSVVVCSSGGVNVEKLSQMNIKHYEIPDIENKSPTTIMRCMIRISKIVKDEKITLIHTHHRMAAFYISFLQLYKKCMFINTCHNTFYNKRYFTKFAYKNCNLIACGEMVKKNLIFEFGFSDEKITVIHNAVKPFNGKIKEDRLIQKLHQEGAFLVGNIGRISEQKGMEYYVKAIPEVVKKYSNARFLIIGSGEKETYLRELAKVLNVEQYLYFLGYRSDVQNIMAQIDIIVLSSLWEGLPLTPIEAYSVGKTIVATAVDGTVEIVRNGIDGILINAKSEKEIAENIIWLMEHSKEMKKYEDAAKKRYEDAFSFEMLANEYKMYYERILR